MDKKIKNYAVESLVILFSIILSFYIEGRRDLAEKNSNKNKLITDLINTIDEDLKQLDYIKSCLAMNEDKIPKGKRNNNKGKRRISKNHIDLER